MKRILLIIITLGICLCSSAQQIRITTKKEKLSDFPMKTTKVLMTKDEDMNEYLKAAMKNIWILSPFEFCSQEEFNAIKGSQDYYFMALDTIQHKKETEANTVTLNIVKGGTGKSIADMLEVVSFPICAVDSTNYHRLDAFLPAIVNLLQNYVKKGLYNGFKNSKLHSFVKHTQKPIFIARGDVSEKTAENTLKKYEKKGISVIDTQNADELFINGADALISYTFSPVHPTKGSVCYKMLFDARTYELYYYDTHLIKGRKGKGLQDADIHKISLSR